MISGLAGNIGLSPAAATAITGFSLVMDPSGTFSTSTQVTGKIYAASYASPTPTMLTTAIADMQTAYLDASGRILPNFVNLGSGKFLWPFNVLVQTVSLTSSFPLGEIGGLTLKPGLYLWTTGVTVSSAVTFSGGSTDSACFPSFTLSPSLAHIRHLLSLDLASRWYTHHGLGTEHALSRWCEP